VRAIAHGVFGEDVLHAERHGTTDLRLSPGRYDVIVTHGPEYSIYEQTVSLGRDEHVSLTAPLTREVEASNYTACDLHVHTDRSPDGKLSLEQRVTTLLAEDVQFAVTTDHNQVTDLTRELARANIGSLPGVEVTSWDPEFGHFNVFPRAVAPAYKRSTADRMLRELRRDPSSFVQINHPRLERHIGYFELTELDPEAPADSPHVPLAFDGIEVWNGYDVSRPSRRDEVFADWLALLSRGHRLVATGSSDSHGIGMPHVGYPRTYVAVPRARAQDGARVLAALKAGRAFVTSGPILTLDVEGARPGDTVDLAPEQRAVHVRVTADAPRWMDLSAVEIWVGRSQVAEAPISQVATSGTTGPRVRVELDVPVGHEGHLVAVVRGERGMKSLLGRASAKPYAFTNPVWLRRRP
jgi:predicted metal-dependent phosphoesterase TrpH